MAAIIMMRPVIRAAPAGRAECLPACEDPRDAFFFGVVLVPCAVVLPACLDECLPPPVVAFFVPFEVCGPFDEPDEEAPCPAAPAFALPPRLTLAAMGFSLARV
jgi:hypothetical protein